MNFKTDNGGIAIKINDAKISCNDASTWGTRLSQLAYVKGNVYISTFSLPRLAYIKEVLGKRPHNIYIVAHKKFLDKAHAIKNTFPDIRIVLRNDIHAKFVLIEPKTVWLSSANFGSSKWIENTVGMHSHEAFNFCKNVFENIFRNSTEVKG